MTDARCEQIYPSVGRLVAAGDLLDRLRLVNRQRCARWHGPGTVPWSGADWSNAMQGEAGEAGNVVKKLRRHETGTGSADSPSIPVLLAKLAEELADTIIYADLVAAHYGIDLRVAIVEKFNLVSEREGFPERLNLHKVAGAAPRCRHDRTGPHMSAGRGLPWTGVLTRAIQQVR